MCARLHAPLLLQARCALCACLGGCLLLRRCPLHASDDVKKCHVQLHASSLTTPLFLLPVPNP